jgi:hypothetical protein
MNSILTSAFTDDHTTESKVNKELTTKIAERALEDNLQKLICDMAFLYSVGADAVRIAYQVGAPAVFLFTGRLNVKVAPITSGLFSAHILPPCASTILLEIYNPNPVP